MPNWVKNRIEFYCTYNEFLDMVDKYCPKNEYGYREFDFEKIIPMPDYISRDAVELTREGGMVPQNNWYAWSIKNWGTKWNASKGEVIEKEKVIVFNTAWTPPHPVIEALAELTRLSFTHYWADEDRGYKAGETVCGHGTTYIETYPDRSEKAYRLHGKLFWE